MFPENLQLNSSNQKQQLIDFPVYVVQKRFNIAKCFIKLKH